MTSTDDNISSGEQHRRVAGQHRVERQTAEAGPVEHRLDDQRARQQGAELQPGDGDDRDHRVAQCVLVDHDPLGEGPSSVAVRTKSDCNVSSIEARVNRLYWAR